MFAINKFAQKWCLTWATSLKQMRYLHFCAKYFLSFLSCELRIFDHLNLKMWVFAQTPCSHHLLSRCNFLHAGQWLERAEHQNNSPIWAAVSGRSVLRCGRQRFTDITWQTQHLRTRRARPPHRIWPGVTPFLFTFVPLHFTPCS